MLYTSIPPIHPYNPFSSFSPKKSKKIIHTQMMHGTGRFIYPRHPGPSPEKRFGPQKPTNQTPISPQEVWLDVYKATFGYNLWYKCIGTYSNFIRRIWDTIWNLNKPMGKWEVLNLELMGEISPKNEGFWGSLWEPKGTPPPQCHPSRETRPY